MSWNELDLYIDTLEAETVNAVMENVSFLRQELVNKGFTVDSFVNVSASMKDYIAYIRGILQDVETEIGKINEAYKNSTHIESRYYYEETTYGAYFRKTDYQRWVLILNDLYDIIVNGNGRWVFLQLTDCIPTINGEDILLRGDSIGN